MTENVKYFYFRMLKFLNECDFRYIEYKDQGINEKRVGYAESQRLAGDRYWFQNNTPWYVVL